MSTLKHDQDPITVNGLCVAAASGRKCCTALPSVRNRPEPRTPEEIAADFAVPLAAVHEAIHYSRQHAALLSQEREEVHAALQAHGLEEPFCMSTVDAARP